MIFGFQDFGVLLLTHSAAPSYIVQQSREHDQRVKCVVARIVEWSVRFWTIAEFPNQLLQSLMASRPVQLPVHGLVKELSVYAVKSIDIAVKLRQIFLVARAAVK